MPNKEISNGYFSSASLQELHKSLQGKKKEKNLIPSQKILKYRNTKNNEAC